MPRIDSPADATSLSFDVTGTGPPVVLLHGAVLSRAIWRGHGYLAELTERHTVVRLDLRGHGRSGAPHDPGAYRGPGFVTDLFAVLDELGIEQAALVGYSLGARVALGATLAHPERVTRLVSLGGSAAPQHGSVETVFFEGVVPTLRAGGMEEFCERQGLGPDVRGRRDRGTRAAFLAADADAMAALFTATEASPGFPDEQLAACETPALWMAGGRDHPRYEESRHAAGVMPRGRFVPLPGRTHGATLSPAGPVLDEALPFLGE